MDKKLTIIATILFFLVIAGAIYICITFSSKNELALNITIDEGKISNNSNEEENYYNDDVDVTYEICTKSFIKVFNKGDYVVYQNPDVTNEFEEDEEGVYYTNKYYVVNTKNKVLYITYPFSKLDGDLKNTKYYIFMLEDEDEYDDSKSFVYRGLISISKKIILTEYDDYSCLFHSDESAYTCEHSETTVVSKTNYNSLYGLISLNDFSTILKAEYDSIYETDNGLFLVTKNKKNGLYNSNGKALIELSYDYLGYNKYFGYIGIKGNDIEVYNTKLDKVDLKTTSLNELYETAYTKYTSEEKDIPDKYLFFTNADSYYWTAGSSMRIQNINEPFDSSNNTYRYKYIGSKYSGEHLVISSICTENYIYVIEDNKAYKINKNEIDAPEDEEGYCF